MVKDTETTVTADGVEGTVTYTMLASVARELAQVLFGVGSRTHDGGWLNDAAALDKAADEADLR